MIPQISHSTPAVLHAILALSALLENLHSDFKDGLYYGRQRMFLQQYNKSIAYLRPRANVPHIQSTLSCCVLFICLEMALGNHETALEHLKNGLHILQHWNTDQGTPEREALTHVFRRLDVQATVFLNSRQPELNATSNSQSENIIPESFSSLREARVSLENIQIRLLYVLTTKPSAMSANISREMLLLSRGPLLQLLAARFLQWKAAFDSLSIRESPSMKTSDLQMSLLLGLHHHTMSLMLDVRSDGSEGLPIHDPRLSKINDLSRCLIQSISSSGKFGISVDIGVIAPLYFSAMIASDLAIRQQAIDLLHQVKWKEGLWDAATVAQIAGNLLRVERDGLQGIAVTGGVPELAQVHATTGTTTTFSTSLGDAANQAQDPPTEPSADSLLCSWPPDRSYTELGTCLS
jgi:hypothetical protein